MERNANDNLGNQNTSDASSGAGFGGSSVGSQGGSQGSASGAGFGGSGSGTTGTDAYGGGSMSGASSPADASFSRDTSTESGGITDRAKSAMGTAQEKLADAGSTVREKAGTWKNSLADALETGADKLRQQGAGGGQTAGAMATGGSVGMVADQPNRMAGMSNQLAGGMQASADWLRDADLDGIKSGIEQQVKDHPGRTLAVAVGLGYLLGKAIRK
jgi:ElaB/YqjD/DUF883 family membrane-anchored ribosome-binding protein